MAINEKDDYPPLKVGLFYNVKHKSGSDEEAEYDSFSTIEAIKRALEKRDNTVVLFEEDSSLLEKIKDANIDIAFNIAEGKGGRGREAQIPAILNLFGIPYTGSDETTLCIALDKALTKRVLATYKIKTPKYVLIPAKNPTRPVNLTYPVIVKPNAEGSSKGISDVAIAKNHKELTEVLKINIEKYHQDMLVEEYIHGREFTVGLIGNGKDLFVFEPMEIIYKRPTQENFCVYSYSVKQNYEKYVDYVCPPDLPKAQIEKMKTVAANVFKILSCSDFARIDFRLDENGSLFFIEVNPLPGLAPNYSDFPMLANFCGVDYDTLINKILVSALKRVEKI